MKITLSELRKIIKEEVTNQSNNEDLHVMLEATHVVLENFTQKIKDVLLRTKKFDDDYADLTADLQSHGGEGLSRKALKAFQKDIADVAAAIRAATEELNAQKPR